MLFVKAAILIVSFIQLSYAFPDGASTAACQSMTPNHGANVPQTTPVPFTATTSVASVRPGQTVNVIINRTNAATTLRGFMVQGRAANGNVIGQFLPTAGMRIMGCNPNGGTATHSSADTRNSITLNWVPPSAGFVGNVFFQ